MQKTELRVKMKSFLAAMVPEVRRQRSLQACDLLVAFIDDIKAKGLYDRVLAFQIGAGSSGEWIKDVSCMLRPTMDYSAPMRRHFRAWLREHYRGDTAALQAAWADSKVSLEDAEVHPPAAARRPIVPAR